MYLSTYLFPVFTLLEHFLRFNHPLRSGIFSASFQLIVFFKSCFKLQNLHFSVTYISSKNNFKVAKNKLKFYLHFACY